jgi:hypothetical protein
MSNYSDIEPEFAQLYHLCQGASMTSVERLYGLWRAVRYATEAGIPGAFVECGVWRGGSVMLMAATLRGLGVRDRDIWLYDTFEGMSEPSGNDVDVMGNPAESLLRSDAKSEDSGIWAYAPIDAVRRNVAQVDYPTDRYRFVKGRVEDTIPAEAPEEIAVLRLDTDWYESTRHELVHLFPRLRPGGVLIIDDYGHWQGARKAVDEYFAASDVKVLLNRLDYTGRIAVKP